MKRETKEGEEKVSDDEPGHLNNNVFSLFNRLLGGHEISNTKDTTERTRRRNMHIFLIISYHTAARIFHLLFIHIILETSSQSIEVKSARSTYKKCRS
jgi:hypothetical protein